MQFQQIQFIKQSAHQFLWSNLEELANEILVEIQQDYPSFLISTAGDFRRKKITLEGIDFLMALEDDAIPTFILEKYKQ